MPLIAIVGRPNVGKSTLYNRLVGGRPALVHDTPGLTRDRRYGEFEFGRLMLRVVDTGGLDPDADRDVIGSGIHRQAHAAIEEADTIVFVVDAMAGVHPLDREVATLVRQTGKPVVVAANKLDHRKRDEFLYEIFELGFPHVFGISAAHGRGIDELIDKAIEPLDLVEDQPPEDVDDGVLRVAFLGKPNAGKSSMVNRLLGFERVLVHDQPGTTTDPVDTPFRYDGREFVLVDTAGIRRRSRTGDQLERISVSVAMGQIRRADVVILTIDGKVGPSDQDARLAGMIEDAGKALVVAINKADLLDSQAAVKAVRDKLGDELRFVKHAPMRVVSALRGDGVVELMDDVLGVAREHERRVPTSELNRFFAEVCESHPPPTQSGRSVRIHYLTQGGTRPPTFLLWANRPKYVAESYRRFLVNQLRLRYGFGGVPLRLVVKAKAKKDVER